MTTLYGRPLEDPSLLQEMEVPEDPSIEEDGRLAATFMTRHTQVHLGCVLFVELALKREGPWVLWRCEYVKYCQEHQRVFVYSVRVQSDKAWSELRRLRNENLH
jgi:hypothetical protein